VLPIIFVVIQLAVLAWAFFAEIRRGPSLTFRALWIASFCGVAGGLDVWYLGFHAYPDGFGL